MVIGAQVALPRPRGFGRRETGAPAETIGAEVRGAARGARERRGGGRGAVRQAARRALYTRCASDRAALWFLTLLPGVISLLLAVIASDGVIVVLQESAGTRELGLRARSAPNTGRRNRLVIGEGFRLSLAGIAVGLAAALAASRLVADLLSAARPNP